MPSPKQDFLDNKPAANAYQDLVSSKLFQEGARAALLQLIADLPATLDPVQASAFHHMVQGARTYMGLLNTIGLEMMVPASRGDPDNLPEIRPTRPAPAKPK